MGAVSLIIIGVLGLAFIILAILLGMTLTKNQKLSGQSVYIPFTAKIDPSTGKSTGFTRTDNKPQISCPIGKKVNIVGAFFNVFDPYTECSVSNTEVDPHLGFICDPSLSSPNTCTSDKDCPAWTQGSTNPFTCSIPSGESSGFCKLNNIKTASCPGKGSGFDFTNIGGFCIDKNMCGANIYSPDGKSRYPVGVPNPYCTPNNTSSQCAIRDASATVAAKCNGKQECDDLDIKDFGDLPCLGQDMDPKICLRSGQFIDPQRKGYCGLPYMPGYPGGVPPQAAGGSTSVPANGNIGYTMHGIYTCVDDDGSS